jgi:hypothetical protein
MAVGCFDAQAEPIENPNDALRIGAIRELRDCALRRVRHAVIAKEDRLDAIDRANGAIVESQNVEGASAARVGLVEEVGAEQPAPAQRLDAWGIRGFNAGFGGVWLGRREEDAVDEPHAKGEGRGNDSRSDGGGCAKCGPKAAPMV